MTAALQIERALKASLKQYCETVVSENFHIAKFVDPKSKAGQLENEIWQEISAYKTLCIDGFNYCIAVVEELSHSDTSIDFKAFKENILQVSLKLDTEESIKVKSQQNSSGKTWRDLLAFSETTIQLMYIAAQKLFSIKSYGKAEAAFCFLSTVDSMEYGFWIGLGHTRYHLEKYSQAVAAYQMAALCNPFELWPYFFTANCYEAESDWDRARITLEDAKSAYDALEVKDKEIGEVIMQRLAYTQKRGH